MCGIYHSFFVNLLRFSFSAFLCMWWKMDALVLPFWFEPSEAAWSSSVPVTTLGLWVSGLSYSRRSHDSLPKDGAGRGVGGGQTDRQPPSDVFLVSHFHKVSAEFTNLIFRQLLNGTILFILN